MKVIHSGSAGDIQYLEIYIDGIGVTTFVVDIQIYQDIFMPCWSAVLMMNDSNNMIMNLPVKPGSEVRIDVVTQTDGIFDRSEVLYIYRI